MSLPSKKLPYTCAAQTTLYNVHHEVIDIQHYMIVASVKQRVLVERALIEEEKKRFYLGLNTS